MPVVVVGAHQRDFPLAELEPLAVAPEDLAKSLAVLRSSDQIDEAVLLSTCMRTEVYAVVERFHDGVAELERFFTERCGVAAAHRALTERLRVAFDDAAAHHLFRVAAGVDSVVVGEGEILRQVRGAASAAQAERTAGPVLSRLFRHALEVGKRARSETAIAAGGTSLSHAAVSLAAEAAGGDLSGRRVVLLGAGEMASGIGRAVARSKGRPSVTITSRTMHRAAELAADIGGTAVPMSRLYEAVADAEVVLCSTGATAPVLHTDPLRAARAGRSSPLVVVDAAVPRDVEPGVSDLAGVKLLDLDDVKGYAEQHLDRRRAAAAAAEEIVLEELERYRLVTVSRRVAPVIAELRSMAESIRIAELERARRRLSGLDPETEAAVDALTRAIVQKLLHPPTTALKLAAGTGREERLAASLRALFEL